jgi:trimethylguanosine synthase
MDNKIISKIFPESDNNDLLKYDNEGLWSITLPDDADTISKILLNYSNGTIFDGTAGIGGNTISFAKFFKKVCAFEIDKDRYNILQNNINVYNINNIELFNSDCLDYIQNIYDLYFFDPPWGGHSYKYKINIRFNLGNMELNKIIKTIRKKTNSIICFKLPNNYDINEFIEYNYTNIKINKYNLIIIN